MALKIKALEWCDITSPREDGDPESTGDFEASNNLGSFYYIRCYFGSDSYGWEVTFDDNFVADRDSPEGAKEAAFRHHTNNVLSAIESE